MPQEAQEKLREAQAYGQRPSMAKLKRGKMPSLRNSLNMVSDSKLNLIMEEKMNKFKLTDLRQLKKMKMKTAKKIAALHFIDQTTSGENTASESMPLEDQKKLLDQDSSAEF